MVEDKPLRVLIADDEPLAAERLQLLLARAEGAQLVGTAFDGDSAINLTEALHPDLLLLDIAMPGLDGIGVARALAAQIPSPAGGGIFLPRIKPVAAGCEFANHAPTIVQGGRPGHPAATPLRPPGNTGRSRGYLSGPVSGAARESPAPIPP